MRLILKLLVNAAALWVAGYLVTGIDLDGSFWTILLVALVFGLVNTLIKPILKALSLPVIILSLGLALLVINAAMLALTAALTDALSIADFWSAVLGAIVISVVSAVLNVFVPED
jgi:putative membrane protein